MQNFMKNIDYYARAAMDCAAEGISVANITKPDQPLVYVNKAFLDMTGYSEEEAIGKNCRFLQGTDTDREDVTKVREAIKAGARCTVEMLNYRKDGTPFWNRLTVAPILEVDKKSIRYYVGIQMDITATRMAAEHLKDLAKKFMEL